MPRRVTPSAALQQIASGAIQPLYLIDGDDDAAKAGLAAAFGDVVEPELRGFNVERLYGGESEIGDVLDAARTLPFGGGRRVVIVLHVENLPAKRESEAAARGLAELEEYLKAPQPQSTLVLVAGLPTVTGKFGALLASRCTVITCSTIEESSDGRRWVQSRAAEAGVKIEPAAVRKLLELAGEDPVRLKEDTERLLLFAAGAPEVDVDDVLAVVGAASSQGEWAVVNAIERGALGVALKELALMLDEGAVPVMVLGQIAWWVRNKMPPARVPAAVDALFRTDIDLKSSGGDPRLLLERLVVELCQR